MSRQRQAKSAQWHRRQEGDAYVRAARAAGYRSRAAYKLQQINAQQKILRAGMTLVDLGAAPGGWSQVAAQAVGARGCVLAVDKLPMQQLPQVQVVHGDFTEAAVRAAMLQAVGAADGVLSDMAPNLSGNAVRDQAQAQALFALALAYCADGGLKAGGWLLVKTFAGSAQEECRTALREVFAQVKALTPDATRSASRECYLLGRGYRNTGG